MVQRVTVTLNQDEYSQLLRIAEEELRNPSDQLHHILRIEIERQRQYLNSVTTQIQNITQEVKK
jgi:hypothetical protein